MVKQKKYIAILFLVMPAVVALYFYFFSDVNRVKRTMKKVAEIIEKNGDESKLVTVSKSNRIKQYLADKIIVDVPVYNFEGEFKKADVGTRMLAILAHADFIHIQLFDLQVRVHHASKAIVEFTAEIEWKPLSGERRKDYLQMRCYLIKYNDIWLLERVEVVPPLEK